MKNTINPKSGQVWVLNENCEDGGRCDIIRKVYMYDGEMRVSFRSGIIRALEINDFLKDWQYVGYYRDADWV